MTNDPSWAIPPTLLFCPGHRADRFDKACSLAPAVVLDLEDAVPVAQKAQARHNALEWLAQRTDAAQYALRINDLQSADGLDDVHALLRCERLPARLVIVVPKTGHPRELQWLRTQLARRFADLRYLALIESLEGLRSVQPIVEQGRPDALGFGAADLAAELGIRGDWEALLFARSSVVAAASSRGLAALDVPELDVADDEALRAACARSKALGFSGKFAIHPRQVPVILQSFEPDAQEIATAVRVREAFEAAGSAACLVDGRMVDVPVYNAARRVLARAHR
jgi:citrate lyase beta subunit